MGARPLQKPIETKAVAVHIAVAEPIQKYVGSCCNAAAKYVQQDSANDDLIISNVFRVAAVVLLHVAIH